MVHQPAAPAAASHMATCALPPAPPSISPDFRPAFESDPLTLTCDKCAAFHERELDRLADEARSRGLVISIDEPSIASVPEELENPVRRETDVVERGPLRAK